MEKWIFIVNPLAGSGKAGREWPNWERCLRAACIDFEVFRTDGPGDATRLATAVIGRGYRKVVACGGDGTANEVANGILTQRHCPPETVIFTVCPVGTGNDWIRTHRIPRRQAAWVRYLKEGRAGYQDVGWICCQVGGDTIRRHFINVAGLSFDGYLARESAGWKGRLPASLFYVRLMLRGLFRFVVPELTVGIPAGSVTDRFYTVNIGICRYSGGGMRLVPQADPTDGRLALTTVRKVGKLGVLLATPLFFSGKIGWHPAVSLYKVPSVTVTADEREGPVWVEADGEFLGAAPVSAGILPRALCLWLPVG
ncbi:MAG: hypothetical protein RLY31_672 [Bacteroidota bacterium]